VAAPACPYTLPGNYSPHLYCKSTLESLHDTGARLPQGFALSVTDYGRGMSLPICTTAPARPDRKDGSALGARRKWCVWQPSDHDNPLRAHRAQRDGPRHKGSFRLAGAPIALTYRKDWLGRSRYLATQGQSVRAVTGNPSDHRKVRRALNTCSSTIERLDAPFALTYRKEGLRVSRYLATQGQSETAVIGNRKRALSTCSSMEGLGTQS
jgi:hypothetical protein